MNYKQHRLYSYMAEPLQFIGMSIDELIIAFAGLLAFFAFDSIMVKLGIGMITPAIVYFIKRVKKLNIGFSLVSFLHWNLGLRFGFSKLVPLPHNRKWHG